MDKVVANSLLSYHRNIKFACLKMALLMDKLPKLRRLCIKCKWRRSNFNQKQNIRFSRASP